MFQIKCIQTVVRLMLKIFRENIWYLNQNNLYAFGRHWVSPSDIFSHLPQNLMLRCLDFFPLPDSYLMISETRYSWCAVSVFGILLCSWVFAGRTKWEFATTWKLGLKNKISQKTWSQQLNWLNSCNDSFIFRYDTHAAQEPGSLLWCHAILSLQFTHVRCIACRGR